jgi:hypothetical protein
MQRQTAWGAVCFGWSRDVQELVLVACLPFSGLRTK